MLCCFHFEPLGLRCEMIVMPLEGTTCHQEDQHLPKIVRLIMMYLLHLRSARAIKTQALGQPSSSKGSSFDDFKKLGPPYFSSTSDPTKAEAWILKIEKFFDVIDCFEKQKASYAAFMLDKEVDHWWCMTKRLLEDQRPIIVDKALIAENDNKSFNKTENKKEEEEQQRKRSRSDGAHDNQEPKMFVSIESQIKGEVVQNLDHGHMIRDCLENKKFIIGKPKEENKEDKQKPRVQGQMFAMTHQDSQATSIWQQYYLNSHFIARALIDLNSTYSLFQYLLLVFPCLGKVVKGFMPMWCKMENILCSIIVRLIKV
ncbi:hypothetical protein AAG906_038526 [Vitis piasezkii]